MECFLFSDLRIFSLSIPLCEWLTSTPFLLLVYYIYIYIYIYRMSLIPLMLALHNTSNAKQCWLADDAGGAGFIKDVLKWCRAVTRENGAYVWVSPECNKMLADCKAK